MVRNCLRTILAVYRKTSGGAGLGAARNVVRIQRSRRCDADEAPKERAFIPELAIVAEDRNRLRQFGFVSGDRQKIEPGPALTHVELDGIVGAARAEVPSGQRRGFRQPMPLQSWTRVAVDSRGNVNVENH